MPKNNQRTAATTATTVTEAKLTNCCQQENDKENDKERESEREN